MSTEKNPKPESYSEKARIEAMDSGIDTVEYQEDGQGGPRQGLSPDAVSEEEE